MHDNKLYAVIWVCVTTIILSIAVALAWYNITIAQAAIKAGLNQGENGRWVYPVGKP